MVVIAYTLHPAFPTLVKIAPSTSYVSWDTSKTLGHPVQYPGDMNIQHWCTLHPVEGVSQQPCNKTNECRLY